MPPKTTAQQAHPFVKDGKIRFTRWRTAASESSLIDLLKTHAPEAPFEPPLTVLVIWAWPYRKCDGATKAQRRYLDTRPLIPFAGKPDLDNAAKNLLDAMVRLRFLQDDSHVCQLFQTKVLSAKPGLRIAISHMVPIVQEARLNDALQEVLL